MADYKWQILKSYNFRSFLTFNLQTFKRLPSWFNLLVYKILFKIKYVLLQINFENMKQLLSIIAFLPLLAGATNYNYDGTGPLNNVSNWVDAGMANPANFTNAADVFIIGSNPDDLTSNWAVTGGVNISAGVTMTQSGASIFTAGTLTINGTYINNASVHTNSFTNLVIESTGSMTANVRSTVTNFTINGSGVYFHNALGSSANGVTNDFPGSTSRTLSATSTVEIQRWGNGGASPAMLPQITYGNLTINASNIVATRWNNRISTLNGDFILENSGSAIFDIINGVNTTVNYNGDIIIEESQDFAIGNSIVHANFGGDFILKENATATRGNYASTYTFLKAGDQLLQIPNSASFMVGNLKIRNISWVINSGTNFILDNTSTNLIRTNASATFTVNGSLDFANPTSIINGDGVFSLNAGATLNIYSDAGITSAGSSGQIHTTNRTFSTSANYIYKGSSGSQVFGNGLPSTVNNLTIANTGGANFTESVDRVINGTLTLSSGTYTAGAGIDLTGANIIVNGGTLTANSTSTLNFTGDLTLSSGTVNFAGTGNKSFGDDIIQSNGTFNLTAAALTVTDNIDLSGGTMSLGGTGNKNIGDVIQSGGTLNITHSSGDLTIGGDLGFSSGTIALSSAATQSIGSLTQSGGTFGLSGGSLTVTNAYSLSGGTGNFNNSGTKTFGSLNLTAGAFNCTDGDLITTGNMVVNGSTIDINNDNLNVGGDLTMNSGTITFDNSPSLSIDGDLTLDGGDVVLTSGVLLEIGGALNVDQGDLDIVDNADVTVNGNLNISVAEGVKIRSSGINGNENGSLITLGTINMIGAGSVLAERHLTAPASGVTFKGWYVGSPIAEASSSLFTSINDKLFDYNPNTNGWVQITDAAPQNLDPFRGYAFRLGSLGATADIDFIGEINSGTYNMTIPLTTSRFELFSNPYPSAIDWNNDAGWTRDFTTEIDPTAQIPKGTSPLTFQNYNANNEGEMPIAANQGFYIRTKTGLAEAPSVSVNNDARLHSSQALLRPSINNLPQLNLTLNYGEVSDDLEIKFRNESHDGYDKFDSWKMFSPDEGIAEPYLYFDEEYIVAASYATLSSSKSVPLGYKYTGQWSNLTWKLASLENMEGIQVILEDKLIGEKVVLENGVSYTFESGNYNGLDRFVLHFNVSQDPNSIQENNTNKVNVYSANGQLYFAGLDKNLPFEVLDLTGKVVQSGMSSNNVVLNAQLSNGHYLVRIQGIEKVYKIWR